MRIILISVLCLFCAYNAFGQVLKPAVLKTEKTALRGNSAPIQASDEQIANAIYKAEGGERTKYTYGIKSVKCETEKECETYCPFRDKCFALQGEKNGTI